MFLRHFVVILASLAFVLPPGACLAYAQTPGQALQTVKKSCCHVETRSDQSHSDPRPTHSHIKCCCVKDATLPEEPIQVAHVVPLVVAIPGLDDLSSVWGQFTSPTVSGPLRPGPRLQILLCVWRC